jgi:hypothetical protein
MARKLLRRPVPPSELLEEAEGDVDWDAMLTDLRARVGG